MESLSKFQYRTLSKLANSATKTFGCISGIPGDSDENQINIDFNSILRLVQLKLVKDVTERYLDTPVAESFAKMGREYVVVVLTHGGQWMFERTKWEKWLN